MMGNSPPGLLLLLFLYDNVCDPFVFQVLLISLEVLRAFWRKVERSMSQIDVKKHWRREVRAKKKMLKVE